MSVRFALVLLFATAAFSAYAAEPKQAEIAVPAHDIARGAVISAGDLVLQQVSIARASSGALRDPADAVGKQARRNLREGETVRDSDLKRPTLVAKGSTVTMVFEAPGMQLMAPGRALGEGGMGETVTILNPTSYRQVEGIVVGPGTVKVGTDIETAAELAAAQN
jgi:flagella basal body P-ring formation protein FlgA